MRIHEVTGQKIRSPEKQRIDALKQQKERVTNALKTERGRQKQNKAKTDLQQSQEVLALLGTS